MKILSNSNLTSFFAALGFLTRLRVPAGAHTPDLGRSMYFFPIVGLGIGLGLTIPWMLGVAAGMPWVQAWLWLGASLYLTRGLHWDGWADLWDGWGSNARTEQFWEILKDSRMGAFGGMGLFMGLAGFVILVQEACLAQRWGVLIWAPVLGRGAAVCLTWLARDLHRPGGLARTFLLGIRSWHLYAVLGQTLLFGLFFLTWLPLLASLGFCLAGLLIFLNIARKQGGLNGDFLGSAIVWGELSALLAWAVAGNV
jgi:adenosylcobinamide-GDP ribazoletransferase